MMSDSPSISEMSRSDLEQLIRNIVRQELTVADNYQIGDRNPQTRQSILSGLIKQQDVPSPTQLLREDRDQ